MTRYVERNSREDAQPAQCLLVANEDEAIEEAIYERAGEGSIRLDVKEFPVG